jgi:hypothetical protein
MKWHQFGCYYNKEHHNILKYYINKKVSLTGTRILLLCFEIEKEKYIAYYIIWYDWLHLKIT